MLPETGFASGPEVVVKRAEEQFSGRRDARRVVRVVVLDGIEAGSSALVSAGVAGTGI